MTLPDVQNRPATIPVGLNRVGFEQIPKHIVVQRKRGAYHFFATVDVYTELKEDKKGINPSRHVDTLDEVDSHPVSIESYAKQLAILNSQKHNSPSYIRVKSKFPLNRERLAGGDEQHIYNIESTYDTKSEQYSLTVEAQACLLCPCALELCEGKASHGQKATISATVFFGEDKVNTIDAGDLVNILEQSCSSPLFYRLKRPEEKQLVQRMFANPKFAEDAVREAVKRLSATNLWGCRAKVRVVSDESIHCFVLIAEYEGILDAKFNV